MKLKAKGTIDIIYPVVHKGKFRKCEFSIFTNERNYYGFQANNNNAYWLTDYKKGDIVEIDFELKGNQYGGRVYNNLIVEKITMLDNQGSKDHEKFNQAKKEFSRNKPNYIKVDIHKKN